MSPQTSTVARDISEQPSPPSSANTASLKALSSQQTALIVLEALSQPLENTDPPTPKDLDLGEDALICELRAALEFMFRDHRNAQGFDAKSVPGEDRRDMNPGRSGQGSRSRSRAQPTPAEVIPTGGLGTDEVQSECPSS